MNQKLVKQSSTFFENQIDSKEWLTVNDVASYLSLTPNAVRLMVHRGQLLTYRLGKRLRFKKRDVDSLLKKERSVL